MATAPKTKQDFRAHAMLREGHKCAIPGMFDSDYVQRQPRYAGAGSRPNCPLECAHIFSQTAQQRPEYASIIFTMMDRFGLGDVVKSIMDGQVDRLSNVIMTTEELHTAFDKLDFWLEEVPNQPNVYDICSPFPSFFDRPCFLINPNRRHRIEFTIDPDVLSAEVSPPELPDARLLALRAACARVAYLSGAAEQDDQIFHDQELIPVLAEDGSSAYLLSSLLVQASHPIGITA